MVAALHASIATLVLRRKGGETNTLEPLNKVTVADILFWFCHINLGMKISRPTIQ